ncbi:MAG: glycosyltransferase, partial [Candidatus Eremiobacteraeota bacterium]|nr:glycosyltransferase [Candidatus Eremiobacteraeota bacterium]
MAIVLNWNAWSDTIACMHSLMQADRAPDHIVVCDNGSLDDSLDQLARWMSDAGHFRAYSSSDAALNDRRSPAELTLVAIGENGGYAAGNNIGLRFALERTRADFVWILNSDIVVARDALSSMLDLAISDRTIAIVGAKLLRYDQPDTIQALGGGYIFP